MNADEIKAGWARRVVTDGAWVLHVPTLAIGQATEFFEAGVFVSDVNGEPVPDSVLKLSSGHALVANPNAFVELTPREVAFFVMATEKFTAFMRSAVEVAAGEGIPEKTTVTLLVSLLRAQQRALETIDGSESPS